MRKDVRGDCMLIFWYDVNIHIKKNYDKNNLIFDVVQNIVVEKLFNLEINCTSIKVSHLKNKHY